MARAATLRESAASSAPPSCRRRIDDTSPIASSGCAAPWGSAPRLPLPPAAAACRRCSPAPCPSLPMQAAKILANLLVAGGTVLFRAASQAYRQAIISEWRERLGRGRCRRCCRHRFAFVAALNAISAAVATRPARATQRCCFATVLVQHAHADPACAAPACLPADGTKAGMTAEGVNAARAASKQMTLREAEMILGIESGATWQEISKVRPRDGSGRAARRAGNSALKCWGVPTSGDSAGQSTANPVVGLLSSLVAPVAVLHPAGLAWAA